MTTTGADSEHAAMPVPAAPGRPRGRAARDRFDAEFLSPEPEPAEQPESFADRALGAPPSPLDRIDQLFRQTSRRLWWGVAALGAVVAIGVVWTAAVDRVITVQSQAVILPPDGLFNVSQVQTGHVVGIAADVGDTVSQGEKLAEVVVPGADDPIPVESPLDGTVVVVGTRTQEVAAAGSTLFVIAPADQEVVAIGLFPAGAISSLEAGQEASVAINGISPDSYGRVEARVATVAEVPVSASRLTQLTGDLSIAAALAQQGPLYEVIVELDRAATPSGLRWTRGEGPTQPVPIGAIAQVSIVVDRRPLIRDVIH